MTKIMVESARRADGRREMVPFYFKRRISLEGLRADYVGTCLQEARAALIDAQRTPGDFDDLWDLRNGLTLYVVLLGEIERERIIRYRAIFEPCVCMAAYLGHDRMLDAFARSGLPIESFEWSTLDVLLAAILGRRQKTVRKLMGTYPALRDRRYVWYGNAGGFCAGYGSLAILRYLRRIGIPLAACARHDRQKALDPGHFGSALLMAVQRRRRTLANDLVAHGEFCEWRNLRSWNGDALSFFAEAVRNGFLDLARLYLEKGCPVNFGIDLEMEHRTTPLRHALMCGHDDVARWLYRRGGQNVKNGIALPMPAWITGGRARLVRPIARAISGSNLFLL